MKYVYVVVHTMPINEEWDVVGVFSSEKKAEEYIGYLCDPTWSSFRGLHIEKWELDSGCPKLGRDAVEWSKIGI